VKATVGVPSLRGTRPADRRASIVRVASKLIRENGYENVLMSDVADAVEVRPSALYRHFAGKQQLLAEVIRDGLAPVAAVVDGLDLRDQATALRTLAELALDHPNLGALWLREVRHLSPEEQNASAESVQRLVRRLADNCSQVRPDLSDLGSDLLAWSIVGVLVSTSFHSVAATREKYSALLASLLERILAAPISQEFTAVAAPTNTGVGLEPRSRRQALLLHATRLFAERRYSGVGIEDVGASLGMAGPSIYNHFSSKSELLGLALTRGAAYLHLQVAEVLATAATPLAGLNGLVSSYTRFAATHPDLGAILLTDIRNLTEPYREDALSAQRDYVDEWTHLLQLIQEHADATQVRLKVQAAFMVINVVTQVYRLRSAVNSVEAISGAVAHMLDITA
jgi:AcrR family transcriptional regulator